MTSLTMFIAKYCNGWSGLSVKSSFARKTTALGAVNSSCSVKVMVSYPGRFGENVDQQSVTSFT